MPIARYFLIVNTKPLDDINLSTLNIYNISFYDQSNKLIDISSCNYFMSSVWNNNEELFGGQHLLTNTGLFAHNKINNTADEYEYMMIDLMTNYDIKKIVIQNHYHSEMKKRLNGAQIRLINSSFQEICSEQSIDLSDSSNNLGSQHIGNWIVDPPTYYNPDLYEVYAGVCKDNLEFHFFDNLPPSLVELEMIPRPIEYYHIDSYINTNILITGIIFNTSDISNSLFIEPSDAGTIDTTSIIQSGTDWSANFIPNTEYYNADCSLVFDYSGSLGVYYEAISFSINTIVPEPIDISYSNIEYYDTKKDFIITFDTPLLDGYDLSLNDISCGTYITANSISQGSSRIEWILDASLETNIDSSAVIQVDYFGKIYSENIIIDTRPRKINSFALSRTQIDYINSDASLTITFNTEDMYNNSVDISSNIILTDNNNSDTNINFSIVNSIWDTSFKIWQGTIQNIDEIDISANLKFSYNNGYEDISANETITLYTIAPQATDISLIPNELTYVDTSGVIEVQFDKDLLESAQEIFNNYISYMPSSVEFSNFSYNNSTHIWSANIDLSSNLHIDTQFDISVNGYGATTGYNETFNIYGDVPDVSSIVFDPSSLFLTYNDTSGEIIVTFDRDLRGKTNIDDLIQLTNSLNISINTLVPQSPNNNVFKGIISVTNIDLQGTASVTVNGVQVSSPFTSNGSPLVKQISYDTILPDVSNISITNGGIRYPDVSGIISVEFTKPLIDRTGTIYDLSNASPITIVTTMNYKLRPLTIRHNSQYIWQLELTILDNSKNLINDISFNYDYTYGPLNNTHHISNSIQFEIDTLERGVTLSVNDSTFTYLSTNTPISVVFDTTDASGENLTSNLTLKNNLTNEDIGFTLDSSIVIIDTSWNGIITITDEIDTSATLDIFYDTTSETLNSSILVDVDTIVPDVSNITFESNNEYNYLTYIDRNGTLTITYDRQVLENENVIKSYLDYSFNDFNINSANKLSDRTFKFEFDVSGMVSVKDNNHTANFTTDFAERTIKIKNRDITVFVNTQNPSLLVASTNSNINNNNKPTHIINYNEPFFDFQMKFRAPIFLTSNENFEAYIALFKENYQIDSSTFEVSNLVGSLSSNYNNYYYSQYNGTITFLQNSDLSLNEVYLRSLFHPGHNKENADTLKLTTINTIRPQIQSITLDPLDPYNLTYVDTSRTIQLIFDKKILDSSINSYFSVSANSSDISYGTFLPIDDSNQIWETTLESLVEQDIVLDVSFGGFYGLPTFDVSFEIDTIIPDVSSIIINDIVNDEFTYLDTSGTIRFELTRPYLEPSSNFFDNNYITYEPSQNLIIESFRAKDSSNQIWEAIVSISGEIEETSAFVKLSYYDTSANYDFAIDTIIPDVSSVVFGKTDFSYNDVSTNIVVTYNRPILETNIDSLIHFEPSSNNYSFTSFDSGDQTIWTSVLTTKIGFSGTNAKIIVNGLETTSEYVTRNGLSGEKTFSYDNILPEIEGITMENILYPYSSTTTDLSGILQVQFSKPIVGVNEEIDLSLNGSILFPSDSSFLYVETSEYKNNNTLWEAIVKVNGHQYNLNSRIDVSFGYIYTYGVHNMDISVNFQVDTRERGVNIQLSHTEFTYLDNSAVLDISFNVEKNITNITDYIFLYKTNQDNSFNFTITPNTGFDLSLNNKKRWMGLIQIDDNDYYIDDATLMFKYDTGYETISDYVDKIKIKTETPDVSSIIINDIVNDEFTYLDTSGTIRFEFTRPYLEPSSNFITNNYLTFEPSQNLIIESFRAKDSSNQTWEAIVSISGEIEETSAFIKLSYYDTSANYDFEIDTIVPDVSSIIINDIVNDEFTYLDTSGTIRFEFTRPYLEPSSNFITNNYLTFEPSQNLIIENLSAVNDSNQIWEAIVSISGEIEETSAFVKLSYYDTSVNYDFTVDTIIPKIENAENDISLNAFTITYLDLSGEISITFDKKIKNISIDSFVNINNDNNDTTLSNFTSTNKTKWTSILTANRDLSANIIVSVNDFYGLNWSNNFYINTIYPEPEYITITKTHFTYNDVSANIEFKFTKELLEPSSNILDQYLIYELSQNIIISDLRNDIIDKTKWTAILTIIGEVYEDNTYIQLIYDGKIQTQNFKVNVIRPRVEQINITNLLYPERNTFTYLDGFDRNNDYKRKVYFDINFNTTLEESDEEIRDKILFEPSQNIIIRNFNRTDKTEKNDYNGGRYFRGEIDINGKIDISNAFIKIDNQFYIGDASAVFHINTIIPQLEQIPNVNSDSFSVNNPIIDISFNTNCEILEDLTRDFINVSPYEYWELLYYRQEEQNRTQWNTRIRYKKEITDVNNLKATIKGNYRGQSVTVDVDMSGVFPQVNSIEFQRNVSNYETSDMLSYQDTSGTIVVQFTNDLSSNRIQETLSSLQQRELIKVQPKEAKMKLNLDYNEISGNICKIVVSSKGEFKSSSSNIIFNASYLGTNKQTTGLSMNTIIPRPIDISLSLLEFTRNNRNAILTVTYDEVILNETIEAMKEHIGYFIKPRENITFTDLSQNQTNRKIWTANLETTGNILDSTGLIKTKYLDPTNVKSFNFLINTVIPFVKPNIGATLQPNGLPRNRMSINLTKSKTLTEQTLIPEINNYGPIITSNDKYNEITINGAEFHPTQLHIKIDYAGKYSQIPNKIRIKYYSPKKYRLCFHKTYPKGIIIFV